MGGEHWLGCARHGNSRLKPCTHIFVLENCKYFVLLFFIALWTCFGWKWKRHTGNNKIGGGTQAGVRTAEGHGRDSHSNSGCFVCWRVSHKVPLNISRWIEYGLWERNARFHIWEGKGSQPVCLVVLSATAVSRLSIPSLTFRLSHLFTFLMFNRTRLGRTISISWNAQTAQTTNDLSVDIGAVYRVGWWKRMWGQAAIVIVIVHPV